MVRHTGNEENSISMKLQVRQLQANDFIRWLPLWRGYLTFYESTLTEQTTQTTWQRLTDSQEPMFALGAFTESGELLGIVHCIYHRSCWTIGDYCYLQDLFTSEAARGQGVATALIEAVYARAKADGASRVHWLTHETNAVAQKLYEKLAARSGFIQYRKILRL
ncbi:GCN5-related N-acetyltransferase [Turneriella parva DSM 21527]|uniref:GCN5-related N-acetyltransferase n=2 Tax=Turneriella TaxID=338321 RepID=I4B2I5_TURPD|nr:GCN5-related N-acetyltransferase [Turneriella parva DSM 21527]